MNSRRDRDSALRAFAQASQQIKRVNPCRMAVSPCDLNCILTYRNDRSDQKLTRLQNGKQVLDELFPLSFAGGAGARIAKPAHRGSPKVLVIP